MASPVSYMIGKSSSNAANTANLYAQLQAPAQRETQQAELNYALNRTQYTSMPVGTDANGNQIYADVELPDPYDSWSTAVKSANTLARRKTISPNDLVASYAKPLNRETADTYGNIKNAYINPEAEGVYDTTPQFDWMGRQVAGVGARSVKPNRSDAMMTDLRYGRAAQNKRYDDAVSKAITAGEYQQQLYQNAYEQQRYSQPYNSFTNGVENQYTMLDRDKHGSDPDYYYNLQRSGRFDLPDYNRQYFMQQTAAREQAQLNAYQASQSTLSDSFYGRGGHDNPSSFPASLSGYRF